MTSTTETTPMIRRATPLDAVEKTSRDAVPDDVRQTAEFQGACPVSATVMVRMASPPPEAP